MKTSRTVRVWLVALSVLVIGEAVLIARLFSDLAVVDEFNGLVVQNLQVQQGINATR